MFRVNMAKKLSYFILIRECFTRLVGKTISQQNLRMRNIIITLSKHNYLKWSEFN